MSAPACSLLQSIARSVRKGATLLSIVSGALLLSACGQNNEDGPVEIAFIGNPATLVQSGMRLSPAAQQIRAATAQGLISIDAAGEIVPAMAERWIVTDDGMSYIFRLRDSDWPDGSRLTAASVRQSLLRNIAALEGTSLGLDLGKIEEIRAMTGRVVEIRLSSPMPGFLQLLAQPELGLMRDGEGIGPMNIVGDGASALLTVLPPEMRGLPQAEDWHGEYRPLRVRVLAPEEALDSFRRGEVDGVFSGRIASLPMVDTGPLARGTVRLDAPRGLFGLRFASLAGFLADPAAREALSMAIDRDTLLAPFSIGGWSPALSVVPPEFARQPEDAQPVWAGQTLEERRAVAAARVAGYERDTGEAVTLRLVMPRGPGADILFARLAADLAAIGVDAARVPAGEPAEMRLVDTVARYAAPRWYLNQFNCSLGGGACSEAADTLVSEALAADDPVAEDALLAAAEVRLNEAHIFIPFGPPIRWALVRADLPGFVENGWSLHPLFPMAQRPI
ncbi:ABC transporter substrate-binding protein [Pseudopontixanthobacter vadosimaris]|uniref:ABC transporter substrate-binding protein n=1 Tax=Pseudopontixanthobacter vadosimaris TaxID=2726450 RepID=UPI00147298E4|nr:ABC transporter substrate-binding protein [Pseudopontixanthobacter vadosimaris]